VIVDAPLSVGGPAALVSPVRDQSQVGDVRRASVSLGSEQGMDENERSTLALIVTEAATNLARHA
jgi:anti-sigma regulatory factor (Ser/Thr protein kinase)